MCEAVFALGQRGGYFFESPSRWSGGNLPDKLNALFSEDKVAFVYCLALGAADSFVISYKDKEGLDRCRSDGLPDELQTFLYEKDSDGYIVRDFSKLQVTLGPHNKSWWAYDGKCAKWINLPKGLNDAIEARIKPGGGWTATPRIVALGLNGNYFFVTDRGGYSWKLSSYPKLNKFMEELKEGNTDWVSTIQNVYVSPYRLQCAAVQRQNGSTVGWNFPPHANKSFKEIAKAMKEDMEAKQKEDEEEKANLQIQQQQAATIAQLRLKQAELQLAEQKAALRILEEYNSNMMAMNTAFNINMINMMSNFYSNL